MDKNSILYSKSDILTTFFYGTKFGLKEISRSKRVQIRPNIRLAHKTDQYIALKSILKLISVIFIEIGRFGFGESSLFYINVDFGGR